ncbi:hypothetical protein M9H77_07488 [Catharanthus roseus]|uniref:Uncharacterized protein n=1 Tax=Catharanthus roseus TaxID=4058 RepID=A0ACC0BV46_CATRO|nr:hypothetical protein M9H77_07488 [Catharanthus roseus]
MSTQGHHDMSVHNPYPFHEGVFQGRPQARGARRGGQGGRGYYRPHEEVPRHKVWRGDNLFHDFGEDPNDNGMVAYMEVALKNMFEEFGDKGETSKLKQLEGENWVSTREGHPTADGSPTPTVTSRFPDKKAEESLPYCRQ